MIKKISILLFSLLSASFPQAPQKLSIGGMDVDWKFDKETITFTAIAPDDGWIGLGFNSSDTITGANLFLFNHTKDGSAAMEYYVVSAGNPKPIKNMGSKNQ